MLTISTKNEDFANGKFNKEWWIVDATDQSLGRLASKVASLLTGKHRPYYSSHVDCGDFVIVINASKVKLTGNKLKDKIYYHHTGYIGGIKEQSASFKLENNPESLITLAVKRMLPRNKLNRHSITKLHVYKDDKHPHLANKPKAYELKRITRHLQK